MRKIKCQFALTKRQEGREVRKVRREMRQNTFSKCKRRNVGSLRRCVVVAIKCLASSLPTPAPSGVEVSGSSSGSNSVAATNNAQIWRNATHRIDCRFISIRCVSIYLSPVVGNWNCISKRLLSASSTSASTSSTSSTSPLLLQLQRFIVLCFLLLSLSLSLSLLSFCFAVIGAIAPGNHCQQLMKAIVGVAAF